MIVEVKDIRETFRYIHPASAPIESVSQLEDSTLYNFNLKHVRGLYIKIWDDSLLIDDCSNSTMSTSDSMLIKCVNDTSNNINLTVNDYFFDDKYSKELSTHTHVDVITYPIHPSPVLESGMKIMISDTGIDIQINY